MAISQKFSSLRELPTVRQLRAFVAVYETGSMSAAAQLLSLTQPAVTLLVRELEDKLQVRLFERTTRRLQRTEAAVEAHASAQRVLAELHALGRRMGEHARGLRGRVQVAATSMLAQTLLPPVLARYARLHPDVQVGLDDCAPGEFVDRVASERIAFGVGTLEAPVPGLQEQVLLRDPLVAAAPRGPGFTSRRALAWKQLAGLPVVAVQPGYGVRRSIDAAAQQSGVQLQLAHEVALLTTAVALAREGLGVALVPASVAAHAPGLVARPLVQPAVERVTSVVTVRGRPLAPAAQALVDLLVQACAVRR